MTHYRLKNGTTVDVAVRPDTNDHNVAYSILVEDEYHIPTDLTGVAVDVGAHIGAATVALAELNPDLRVVAIEPLAENFELLERNTARYGERVTRLQAAAGSNGRIRYGYSGTESAAVHRFIGNQSMPEGTPYSEVDAPTVSLSEIVAEHGPITFLKIDCEGCEYSFLDDPALINVRSVHGEFHSGGTAQLVFLSGIDLAKDRTLQAYDQARAYWGKR